jgi:hypothetical protein
MTGHRQLEAAAERRAVKRHDHRPGTVFDAGQQVVDIRRTGTAAPRRLFQLLDIGARDKGPAGPRSEGTNPGILFDLAESVHQSGDDLGANRVDGRVIDDGHRDRRAISVH